MAVTVTLDPKINQKGGAIGAWLSVGKKVRVGSLNFSTSGTFTASSLMVIGLQNINHVKINDHSGYAFEYDYDSAGILGFAPGGATTVMASVTGFTDVKFIAVGD